jgi:hypothetical protein
MRSALFRDVMERRVADCYRSFETSYQSHLQGSSLTLEDGTDRFIYNPMLPYFTSPYPFTIPCYPPLPLPIHLQFHVILLYLSLSIYNPMLPSFTSPYPFTILCYPPLPLPIHLQSHLPSFTSPYPFTIPCYPPLPLPIHLQFYVTLIYLSLFIYNPMLPSFTSLYPCPLPDFFHLSP